MIPKHIIPLCGNAKNENINLSLYKIEDRTKKLLLILSLPFLLAACADNSKVPSRDILSNVEAQEYASKIKLEAIQTGVSRQKMNSDLFSEKKKRILT